MGGVLIRLDDDKKWRIYWSDTMKLANDRAFDSIEETGPFVRALADEPEPSPIIGYPMRTLDRTGKP